MPGLPNFENPPVTEVGLVVQFAPIQSLTAVHFGLLWQKIRDKFPGLEQHMPVPHLVERFGALSQTANKVQFQISDEPVAARTWFKSSDETELIQLQSDRLMHNWRKIKGDERYPRYEDIKSRFKEELEDLSKFLISEKLGRLLPDQCEVTYVNHIVSGDGWENFGQLGKILTQWSGACNDDFLPLPENLKVSQQYIMQNAQDAPAGRLYVDLQSATRVLDAKQVFVLNMTSRVRPGGETISDAIESLDLGRQWIVKGFISITTDEMHKQWGRKNDT